MCAEDNMQVANCTTPANYFHILRRQLHRDIRKPLILMTPKSLLRHKRAVSTLAEFGPDSHFHRLLWDDAETLKGEKIKLVKDDKIRRVVLCSGKVYYDLYEDREKRGVDDVYLLRVEQLYPFPLKALVHELSRFKKADVVWCQEEPKNMGSWTFIEPYHGMGSGAGRRQGEASALRRSSGVRRHRHRPDVAPHGAAEGLPRRGARRLSHPIARRGLTARRVAKHRASNDAT
jgi:2-oxoglutarate dehydrogenase complex dehydrogenase (E1) component-like enzyme